MLYAIAMGQIKSLGFFQSCYQGLSLRGQGQDFFLKAKDMKIFQGQLRQLPLQAKICIAVTETEYVCLITQSKRNDL